jgi:hypothetical protein
MEDFMSKDRSLQVSGTIDAPPDKAFALLADPARHTELDGAGMLRSTPVGRCPRWETRSSCG